MKNIDEKVEEIVESYGCCCGDFCDYGEHNASLKEQITTLIQKEREEAVRGFADILEHKGWGDMTVEIETYLSQTKRGGEKE